MKQLCYGDIHYAGALGVESRHKKNVGILLFHLLQFYGINLSNNTVNREFVWRGKSEFKVCFVTRF